jgi:N-acetylmuramoyl-L-alanine amidase
LVLVIQKRFLIIALFTIIISYIAAAVTSSQTISTIALPITNKVIVLDAGHGGFDPGAVSKSGLPEKNINLDIVLKLQGFLEQSGCVVQLTRATDEAVKNGEQGGSTKSIDLKNRKSITGSSQADLFLSVHLNSFPDGRYKGVQTFYPKESEESKKLAVNVQRELKNVLEIKDNREALRIDQILILENAKIPSAIVECGFLSNEEEQTKLNSDQYRKKIAWGIYLGIIRFFEGE